MPTPESISSPAYASAVAKAIAKSYLGIHVLETQSIDSLDFHDLHVSTLREALKAAFEAGRLSMGSAEVGETAADDAASCPDTCPKCNRPTHASESADDGTCLECLVSSFESDWIESGMVEGNDGLLHLTGWVAEVFYIKDSDIYVGGIDDNDQCILRIQKDGKTLDTSRIIVEGNPTPTHSDWCELVHKAVSDMLGNCDVGADTTDSGLI